LGRLPCPLSHPFSRRRHDDLDRFVLAALVANSPDRVPAGFCTVDLFRTLREREFRELPAAAVLWWVYHGEGCGSARRLSFPGDRTVFSRSRGPRGPIGNNDFWTRATLGPRRCGRRRNQRYCLVDLRRVCLYAWTVVRPPTLLGVRPRHGLLVGISGLGPDPSRPGGFGSRRGLGRVPKISRRTRPSSPGRGDPGSAGVGTSTTFGGGPGRTFLRVCRRPGGCALRGSCCRES
jgi:hypothetical protein